MAGNCSPQLFTLICSVASGIVAMDVPHASLLLPLLFLRKRQGMLIHEISNQQKIFLTNIFQCVQLNKCGNGRALPGQQIMKHRLNLFFSLSIKTFAS